MTTDTRQFECEIEIAAPRGAVWKALTDERELTRWFAPDASVEPRVGGAVEWRWDGHHTWPQTVEVWEPEARLRTRYDSPVEDGAGGRKPLFIDFELSGEGGTTTLRVVQSGFGKDAAFDEEYDGISRGWPVELRSLRLYLEQHAGRDRRVLFAERTVSMSRQEAWKMLAGDDGMACAGLTGRSEGDAFRFETCDEDVFEGKVLTAGSCSFTGVVENCDHSWLRVSCEEWGGATHVWLWLATYGGDEACGTALEGRWKSMLERLFATNGAAAGGA